MQRAVFHGGAGPGLAARLAALRADGLEVEIVPPEAGLGALAPALARADMLWHVLAPATAEVLALGPALRLVQKVGVGVNTIDLGAAQARGIAVCNMPGTNTRAVAEHALLLALAALRRLPELDAATRAGRGWRLDDGLFDRLGELGGRRVGLLGYGAVPRALAPALRALGAEVLYWRREPDPASPDRWLPLPELLAAAEILSLHLPLGPGTAGLVDAAALARLPPGAVLVNTARGGLVDRAALLAALRSGRLAAAGLDVFPDEPVDPADPLLALPQVVLTPHVAWRTPETMARSLAVAVENGRRLRAGEPLLHRVA